MAEGLGQAARAFIGRAANHHAPASCMWMDLRASSGNYCLDCSLRTGSEARCLFTGFRTPLRVPPTTQDAGALLIDPALSMVNPRISISGPLLATGTSRMRLQPSHHVAGRLRRGREISGNCVPALTFGVILGAIAPGKYALHDHHHGIADYKKGAPLGS